MESQSNQAHTTLQLLSVVLPWTDIRFGHITGGNLSGFWNAPGRFPDILATSDDTLRADGYSTGSDDKKNEELNKKYRPSDPNPHQQQKARDDSVSNIHALFRYMTFEKRKRFRKYCRQSYQKQGRRLILRRHSIATRVKVRC